MKSLNIKIPMAVAVDMDKTGRLNPDYLASFINTHKMKSIDNEPVGGLTVNYTFKIDSNTHRTVKMLSIEHDLAMNEFIGRLLLKYY